MGGTVVEESDESDWILTFAELREFKLNQNGKQTWWGEAVWFKQKGGGQFGHFAWRACQNYSLESGSGGG